jgi:hypothetical protein
LLVSSDAFEGRPSLQLERLIRKGIYDYVASYFKTNKNYEHLGMLVSDRASTLTENIVEKAAGGFMSVHLIVVQALLDGLTDADRMSDLMY